MKGKMSFNEFAGDRWWIALLPPMCVMGLALFPAVVVMFIIYKFTGKDNRDLVID